MSTPRLVWDLGTAYDLFISLMVLHHPAKYGLRGAWARGVRARLPAAEREILKQAADFVRPWCWVYSLPDPKDGMTALRVLEQTSPAERLAALAFHSKMPVELSEILQAVAARRAWDEEDVVALQAVYRRAKPKSRKRGELVELLGWWARSQEFGDRYLEALRAYYEAFFAEEEIRIRPALEETLIRSQGLAERLALPALLEELSQGLRLAELPQVLELVLAPSFWSTPLLIMETLSAQRELILFGARPPDASLVPGEVVPDALMRALKALGDPTRLRILRYLTTEPLSPTQLARRLRLRAPTVIHHLYTLRMAGLVHLTLGAEDKRRYAARPEALKTAISALDVFLESGEREESETLDSSSGSI